MADQLSRSDTAPATDQRPNKLKPRSRWRLALGLVMSLVILTLAYLNRAWILKALALALAAQPLWLAAALAIIMVSFLISSQVFQVVLRSLGYHVSVLRLWATALVAIVTSQSLPAGSVGSYAFLLHTLRQRGISSAHAALVATLEALSYAGAMLLFSIFGLIYLATKLVAAGEGTAELVAPVLAAVVALLLIGGVIGLLTRSQATLSRWLLRLHGLLQRLLRRPRDAAWVERTVAELARARALVAERRGIIALLVLIQLTALCGHSLAMYVILISLGTHVSYFAVVTAFSIALLTSTVNVLPGGGGTVEAALVAVLAQLGVGDAAVPAAILFRLLNFWVMLPLAAGCYAWLMRERKPLIDAGA